MRMKSSLLSVVVALAACHGNDVTFDPENPDIQDAGRGGDDKKDTGKRDSGSGVTDTKRVDAAADGKTTKDGGSSTTSDARGDTRDPALDWLSPACQTKVDELLAEMTVDEKVGQMIMADNPSLGAVDEFHLGAMLYSAGAAPGSPEESTPADWAAHNDALHAAARATRLKIPLLVSIDAVHGNAKVKGAVVFPHNVGLGCTGDEKLVEEVGRTAALEIAGTGFDWTFAPVLAAARDVRWGRTYEAFGETSELAAKFGAAMIRGLQGTTLGGLPSTVLATAKHFAGDGGTTYGTATAGGLLDRGDTRGEEAALRKVHVDQYRAAIRAGVGSVMISYSSWNGTKMHGHKKMVTDVLKGELGFKGLVISDYDAVNELPGDLGEQVVTAVNAGVDMFMMGGGRFSGYFGIIKEAVPAQISQERLDDAARRILLVKCGMGLFERDQKTDAKLLSAVGSEEHRKVARQAVQKSVVVLKNGKSALPLSKTGKVTVISDWADGLRWQMGGWTIQWEGIGPRMTGMPGTTLLQAFKDAGGSNVSYSANGEGLTKDGTVVVVVGEEPYAEMKGDADYRGGTKSLELIEWHKSLLAKARASGAKVVAVVLSGRPLLIDDADLANADAWVAAWLPGSEAAGVTDVLYGEAKPVGKLGFSWLATDASPHESAANVRWPLGHGLTY